MRSHTSFRWLLVILGSTLVVRCFFLISDDAVTPAVASQTPQSVTIAYDLSTRLIIPTLNVDAPVESVGLTPQGGIGIPKNYRNVAWFTGSVRPGEKGTAIIDGHSGWNGNRPAIFDGLRSLRVGDIIRIEDAQKNIATFSVRELRIYKDDEIVPEVFLSKDGGAHLNLITCGGVWDEASQGYANRLVVFADRVDTESSFK